SSTERTNVKIAEAYSVDGNYTIKVIYIDYGGSFAENGGIHVKVFLQDNSLPSSGDREITKLVKDSINCSPNTGVCVEKMTEDSLSRCVREVRIVEDESQEYCVVERLEDF